MQAPLGELDAGTFLREYWQRQPCLIRNAFNDFIPPLDGDDLAGLACEPLAESRLIEGPDQHDSWTLRHGPFTESDFAALGDTNWTLLVQDAEKHYLPLQEILHPFSFLPSWRLDDLMISFAAPGGSVGPHVDQYDVFLLQASGRRHWSIAQSGSWQARDDAPIDMLSGFDTEQEWTLEPGDMLYLPPGVAHHGVALDPCLTYSVGFRAPSTADLAMGLGEWLGQQADSGGRYSDPLLKAWPSPGEIGPEARDRFRQLLRQTLDNEQGFGDFLAAFMSRYRQAHEPAAGPEPLDDSALAQVMSGKSVVRLHPWARAAWVQRSDLAGGNLAASPTSGQARLYISGQVHECSVPLAQAICAPGSLVLPDPCDEADQQVLLTLLASGQVIVDC